MLLEVGLLTTTIYSISVNLQTYTSIHHTTTRNVSWMCGKRLF